MPPAQGYLPTYDFEKVERGKVVRKRKAARDNGATRKSQDDRPT